MNWLGRPVVWVDEDGSHYGGIVSMDNRCMNEVILTVFKPHRSPETVRGVKQDGPLDPMPRDCWLADRDYDD